MCDFLGEVDELRNLPDSTAIAFELIMALGEHSHGEMNSGGSGYGEKPSVPEIDDLLVELAKERGGD